jgi:threonine/homoserine/homoserine lactone efflux protein
LLIGLLAGLLTGFLLSVPPMGPTNFAIMSKGFKGEKKNGVAIGAGAGFMDMIYVLISYGGFALIIGLIPEAVITFYENNTHIFKIVLTSVGCIVVVFYGFKILRSKLESGAYDRRINEEDFQKQIAESKRVLEQNRQRLDKLLHTHLTEKARKTEKLYEHSEEHLKQHLDKKLHSEVLEYKRKINASEEELQRIIEAGNNNDPDANPNIWSNFLTGCIMCVSSITLPASWFLIVSYMKGYNIIESDFLSGLAFGIGVWAGTIAWFYLLVRIISRNTHRISPAALNKLNIGVGVILFGLGLFLAYKVFDYALA